MLTAKFNSVKLLSNALRDVDDILPERDLTSEQQKNLEEIARGCNDVVDQLREKLKKNQELDSKAKGMSGKPRKIWKRLQWDQAEIDEFRNRIGLSIIAFNTFLGRITRCPSLSLCDLKARSLFIL